MNRRKKMGLITILLLAVLALRETGFLTFDLYKSKASFSTNTSWYKNLTITKLSKRDRKGFAHQNYSELPIVVLYKKDTVYKEALIHHPIIIEIRSISPGFLWLPLYKSASFSSAARSIAPRSITKFKDSSLIVRQGEISGDFVCRGNISVTGICSRKTAFTLVKNLLIKEFVKQARTYYSRLDGK